MAGRNLGLNERVEDSREARNIIPPVQFELVDIKNHFDQSLEKIQNQYEVVASLKQNGKGEDSKNIWRSQIIFLEGILDFYLHEMSKYCLYRMFKGEWEKSKKYPKLQIPIVWVERGIESSESREWFFAYLNERFSRDVFLSLESMRDQLNLIGVGYGNVMHEAFKKNTINESQRYGDEVIRKLFYRRNAIAHQLDRNHASAEQADISREYVENRVSEVVAIVEAIHKIVMEKE